MNFLDRKNVHGKRNSYIDGEGLWVNGDGSTIAERKPLLKLKSNHYRYVPKFRIVKGVESN